MRKIIIFLLFILIWIKGFGTESRGHEGRFQQVDEHVSQVNKQFIFHPELLSQELCEGLTNDYDKVRAFYVWIAKNIDYDFIGYIQKTKGGQGVNQVMRSGKAMCTGFSLLFKYFCYEANIESKIVEGYAKGYGYRKKQKFKEVNHSWNAVKIYDRWYLLDVTWAIGNPTNLSKHKKKIDLNTYFLVHPEEFVKTHLPQDPSWQLLDNKISLSEFEADEYSESNDLAYNSYSPEDYTDLNEYDADILTLKRSKAFHPKNEDLKSALAFAYLYKGISLIDEIWKMEYYQLLDTASYLERSFTSYMDSASQISDSTDYYKVPYSKHVIPDEINFQNGIFNYELAVELFSKAKQANIRIDQADRTIEKYFELAQEYFKLTPSTSIYNKDAQEYLEYITDFKSRKVNWFTSN